MTITSRQFEQLTEMGIDLWQSRLSCDIEDTQQNNFLAQSPQSLTSLTKQKLFSDILHSLNLTIGEVKAQDDHLDIGLFNWYFVDKELNENSIEETTQENAIINCIDNKLISPCIETIAQSANLKKQLWHAIANNLL